MLTPGTDRRCQGRFSYIGAFLLLGLLAGACSRPPAGARHIRVVMKKYAIEPAEIHLRRGETVVLDVYSADVQHGLEIPAWGINEPVHRNFPAAIVVTPPRAGQFSMHCSVLCGPGHDDMVGKIVVE